MADGSHFGWPKITFDRISRHFWSIRNFYFLSQNGCRRPFWMTENHFWSHFSPFQINKQLLFVLTKWLLAAILDDQKSLLIALLAISDQIATFLLFKMADGGHIGWPKITLIAFLAISDQYATFFYLFFFHFGSPIWAILDYRKSLSIAFLAISDQSIHNFFFNLFTKWPPAAILEVRFPQKTIGFFPYVLSMAMPNMKLIGEIYDS